MEILTVETTSLGDRSYLVHDGTVAAAIDPQRDIDRVLQLVDARSLDVAAVFETHIHNDYVTGGFQLARVTGATYHVSADEDVAFDFAPVSDGDKVEVGTFVVRAVATPGHTPTHVSYVLNDGARDIAVFTGGSVLYGSVGRTDLIAADRTEDLTRQQHRSARRILTELEDHVEVRPTHGFGSFCSSGDTSGRSESTVGIERRDNDAMAIDDEDDFVRRLMAGLDDYPAYYTHMGPINRTGPTDIDLSPPAVVDTPELLRRIAAGEWVVDLRTRTAFARGHIAGTVNIELADPASTYLGWLMSWGTPVTLIADSYEQIARMQRQLVRIGIDRPAGQIPGGPGAVDGSVPRHEYQVADFAALRRALDEGQNVVVLDTRRTLEWAGGHLPMAIHVPLHRLQERMEDVPNGELWVHCASGYRSSIAASLLARAGRDVVLIDDSFDHSAPQHFKLTDGVARG